MLSAETDRAPSHDPGFITWAEIKNQKLTNRATQVPLNFLKSHLRSVTDIISWLSITILSPSDAESRSDSVRIPQILL